MYACRKHARIIHMWIYVYECARVCAYHKCDTHTTLGATYRRSIHAQNEFATDCGITSPFDDRYSHLMTRMRVLTGCPHPTPYFLTYFSLRALAVLRVICAFDMMHSYMRYNSMIHVIWLVRLLCDMTRSFLRETKLVYWLVRLLCDMTR